MKDGRIMTYGGIDSTVEEPIESTLPAHRYAWSLHQVKDRAGNTMTYRYHNDLDTTNHCVQQYISQIDYTGSDTDGVNKALKSVVFIPETREDPRTGFAGGFCWKRDVRFREIQVLGPRPEQATSGAEAPKALLKSYRLTYQGAPTNSRPMLAAVTECDGAGICKPPVQFNYQQGDPDFDEFPINFAPATDLESIQSGDIDGDGTDDLFYWGAGQADGRRIWYQLSNGDTAVSNAFRDPVVPTIKMADGSIIQSANKDFNQEITDPSHRVARGKFRYFDFDMDGRLDFALIHPEQNDVFENMYIFHNDGGDPLTFTQIPGIVYEIPTHFFNPSQGFNLSLQNPPPEFADLNGDGLVDSIRGIITVPDTGESVWDVRLNKGGGFDEFPLPTTDLSPGWNGGRVVANRFINPHSAGMFTRFGHWQSFVYGSAGIVSVIEDETLNSRVVLKQTDLDLTGTAWDYNYWLGDLNNDGLMDIVLPRWIGSAVGTKDPASLAVYMSHGDGKFGTPTVTLLTSAAINGLSDLHSFDYDQDGVADLVAFDTTTQADRDAHRNSDDIAKPGRIYRSSGNGQVSPQGQIKTADGATIVGPQQMLDFDGDGLEDFIGVAYRNVPPLGYSLFRHRGAKANLLTTVTDGLGRRTTFTHKPIRQVSQRSVGCSWPTYCVNSGVWFVSDVDTDSGDPTGRTLHDGYTYLGARSDLGGRGWLGVASRTATRFRMEPNNTPYIVTTTTFDNTTMYGNRSLGRGYDFPFRNVVKSEVTTYKDIGGVQGHEGLLSKVYTLDVVTSASVGLGTVGQSFSVGPVGYTEVLQENTPPPALQRLTSRITESPTQWQYDTHGNRTHEDVLDHLADGTVNRRTTDQTFTQDEGNWLVGQAKTRTVVDQTAAGTSQRTWAFTPDPTTGLLNHVTYQAGVADEQLDVDYVRDSHGMPKTITSSIVSGEKRIKSVVYDDFDGTFPQLVINAKGQPHRTLIHPGLGVDIVDEDANGLRSVGTVDGFGRRRSGKRPDGSGAQIHYEAPAFPMAAYQVRVNGDNGAEARLNFDDWNRVIAREWKDFGTAGFNRVRTTYDADQVFLPGSVTIPSLTPEDPSTPAATFAYDSEGRLLRQTLADGTTDTFVRDNEIQTRVLGPGGRTARLLEDGRGRPMTSAQTIGNSLGQAAHEATTSYTYGLFGQIATVTDAKANVTRIAYDASGRRVSMTDPDTGTSTFTWNGFGDLVQEKDANGQVRTYIPDELGRVRQAITPDGVTAFDWDTAANGVGRIGNTTSPDGVDCTYGYDNFGRQSSQSWTLATGTPGADGTYTMGLSYDSAGRPSTLTYPSVAGQVPIAIRQAYAANGATAGLFRGSNAVWTVNMRDPASRISLETAANGVATSHDYIQATGQVHEIKSVRGAQILRDLLYGYDEAGNVQQRTVDGKVETFGYDTLDRLVSWEQGSSTTNPGTVYSYDDIGNMLARQQRTFTNHAPTGSITDQTTFTPGDGTTRGPHQIASSSLGAFGYDQRGNQTSAPGRTIGFTIFNLPRSITAGTATTTFAYDGGQSRVLKKSGTATIVTLGGMFERRIIGATKTDVFYVAAEGRSVAQISWTENAAGTAVTEQVQYLHDDHVGSVEAITSSTGTVAARQKFDPFGDRIGSAPSGIRVGFQELEQDDEIGLVNMNGRMYDPRQARFVSADPEVQNPFFGQDLNRYAFVRNSPLNYRDPTGFMGESVPQAVDPEEPAPIGGASDRTSVIYTSGGYFGGDSWGNWGPIAGGTPDAFANPPPGPNGGTGPEIVPGNADDNGSRGPQISPSGPPSDSGGGSQTRPAPGWHLLRGQELAGSCVAAACRNAIVLLTGKDVSEAQIRNELQKYSARPIEWDSPGGGGTQIWRAPNVLNDHGLPVQVYRELTSNRIKTTADLVRVVGQGMVMVGGTGRGGGSHVMLLLKTRSDGKGGYQFLVVNSADGEKSGQRISQRWISEQEFGEFYDPDDPKSWIVIQIGFPR